MKFVAVTVAVAVLLMSGMPAAQWLSYRTAGIPRTPDGRPHLTAPAPRGADGKPIIGGLWRPAPRIIGDIRAAMTPGERVPFRPWAEALYQSRLANNAIDDPTASCIVGGVPRNDFVPYPFKILETPGAVVILYEAIHSYRQIFTDGRALPKDPNPAWLGYSVGRWDGDAFVVETIGFNENVWLDNAGLPATDQLRVTERFVRKDFGHMNIEITIDDPKAYTRPWVVTQPLEYQPDNELIEYICNENNRYFQIVPGAKPAGPTLR